MQLFQLICTYDKIMLKTCFIQVHQHQSLLLFIQNKKCSFISEFVLLLSGPLVAAVSDPAGMPLGVQGTKFNLDILQRDKL